MKDKDFAINNEEQITLTRDNVSSAVIKRLPRYFRSVRTLIASVDSVSRDTDTTLHIFMRVFASFLA